MQYKCRKTLTFKVCWMRHTVVVEVSSSINPYNYKSGLVTSLRMTLASPPVQWVSAMGLTNLLTTKFTLKSWGKWWLKYRNKTSVCIERMRATNIHMMHFMCLPPHLNSWGHTIITPRNACSGCNPHNNICVFNALSGRQRLSPISI